MKKYFLIVFFTITTGFLSAQDLFELYKNYLPANITDTYDSDDINEQLVSDAYLDPSLIYLRIIYYKNLIEKKDFQPKSNGLNYIRDITLKKYNERNKWLEDKINYLAENYNQNEYYSDCIEFFAERIIEIKDMTLNSKRINGYDANLDYFFRYLLYSPNLHAKYDSTLDYTSLCKDLEKAIALSIKKQYDEFYFASDEAVETTIEKTINYWFIINEYYPSSSFVPKMLIEYFISTDKIKDKTSYTIQYGFLSKLFNNETEFEFGNFIKVPYLKDVSQITEKVVLTDYKSDNLHVSYKVYLRDKFSIFAYLNTSIGISFGKTNYQTGDFTKQKEIFFKSDEIDHLHYTAYSYNFKYLNFSMGEKKGLFLKITTPVLYITKNLMLEVGAIGSIESIAYTYNYTYDFSKYKVNKGEAILLDYVRNEKISGKKTLIFYSGSPYLSVKADLFNLITTDMFIHLNGAGMNFGLSF